MNWKRGLSRIYVVVWALFAVTGIVFAVLATGDAIRERKPVAAFLSTHRDCLTLADLQQLSLDSLRVRVGKRFVMHKGVVQRFPRGASDEEIRTVLGLRSTESLHKVPTFMIGEAHADGFSDAAITAFILQERAAGRDVRLAQKLTYDQFAAFRNHGLSTEQLADLDMGEASDDELSTLQFSASLDPVARPTVAFARIWALWFGVCVAAPALILWTLRWIASGFSTRERAL